MHWLTKFLKGSTHKISKGPHHSVGEFIEFDPVEIDYAIAISIAEEEERCLVEEASKGSEEDKKSTSAVDRKGKKVIIPEESESNKDEPVVKVQLGEDEQLEKALQESLNVSPPTYNSGNVAQPYPFFPAGYRICAGCNTGIGRGQFLSCMDTVWHPDCFRCHACNQPIIEDEFSMSRSHPYHKSCYKEEHHPRCDVCKNFVQHIYATHIPINSASVVEFREHPFWHQKCCPSHDRDGTPRCCSCERMEPRDANYLILNDGRKLCLECLRSSIMDTHECQPVYLALQDFFEGLLMKVEQQIPMLLVERQALNEALEGEKNGYHHMPETRGLCLSEEQTVATISRTPRIGAGHRILDMFTEPYRLILRCEVTAILILYGLPRLLTGSILAHEMMHAWLRLKGYYNLSPQVEEGICQVLAHLWLDSEMYSSPENNLVLSSALPSSSFFQVASKKGVRSEHEKKLCEFFKHQIEDDSSSAYGDGFRIGYKAVSKYGLSRTLHHIKMPGTFPI